MSFEPGDIVVVAFPFTDLPSRKQRPAVVVSPAKYAQRHDDIVFLALTSKAQHQSLKLSSWQESGLLKETWCKPVVATVSSACLVRKLGKLQSDDVPPVTRAIAQLIAPSYRQVVSLF